MTTLWTCLFSACSFNPPLDLTEILPGQPPVLLSSVPFYPQQQYQCGPAALAGVLGAAGVTTDPASLSSQVYLPGRQGSLQLELLAATRRAARIPYLAAGEPGALFAQLEAGRPVLVLQNLQTRSFPIWHYAVVVGFDVASNRVYLNSGEERGLAMDAPAFLRTWDWAGRWALVALRPGELPAQVELARYVDAVVALEGVAGSDVAAPAWRAALQHWPQDPRPYLALGNQAYAGQNLPVAIDYYHRGLRQKPGDPALGNNLATVLGELGCPRTASTLLEPIQARLPGDSNWRPVIAGTLAELDSLAPTDGDFCTVIYSAGTVSGAVE